MRFCLFIWFVLWCAPLYAQIRSVSNGVNIPATDTIRVLIVFAEVDYSQGPCPQNLTDPFQSNWPKNFKGITQPPANANLFFDQSAQTPFQGFITAYYHKASFGKYVLLGDYLPFVVSLPCAQVQMGTPHVDPILKALHTYGTDTTLTTANGWTLRDFDQWTPGTPGMPKLKKSDGKVDILYIIWKNNRFLNGLNTGDNAGFGLTAAQGKPFKNMLGINNVTSFNSSIGDLHAYTITIAEHLHGIFGGNEWHSAGGRGTHTFPIIPHTYGLTAQSRATMQGVCGWDRWMMKWKSPQKQFITSALTPYGVEVPTDSITIQTHPQGGTFILRDHIATGDAIRIKLPHIDWQQPGQVKNQYLWLEFRTMRDPFDAWFIEECADYIHPYTQGTPGVYAYIQVGKDIRDGDIYGYDHKHPNALASWLYPLTAEGNYDFNYRRDKEHPGIPGCGSWGNRSIPIDAEGSLPNPFTGCSDLYNVLDYNQDGKLYTDDAVQPGLSDWRNDTIDFNYHESGDGYDAFGPITGKMELSISTNPAPVPVYTAATDFEFKKYFYKKGDKRSSFENRIIWLNGLQILFSEIIDFKGQQAIRVTIRWDQYRIENDVRWCGNINVSPHDFDTTQPSLIVAAKRSVLLDRSQSPTQVTGVYDTLAQQWWFADTTHLTILPGAKLMLEPNATLRLLKGSQLIFEPGSSLIMSKNARIIIEKGCAMQLPPGVRVSKHKRSKIKYVRSF